MALNLKVLLSGQDLASGVIGKTGAAVTGLTTKAHGIAAAAQHGFGKLKEHAQAAGRAISSVTDPLKAVVKWAAGIGIAAGVGIVALAKHVADSRVELLKYAGITGLTVEQLSALGYAAEQSEVPVEELRMSLMRMAKSAYAAAGAGAAAFADDAEEGGEAAAGAAKGAALAYQNLGVSVTDAQGRLKGSYELFLAIADGLSRIPDRIERSALAMQLFGKSGAKMLPFLNEGSAGVLALMQRAEMLGLVVAGPVARQADVLQDALDDLRLTATATGRQIATGVTPWLIQMANETIPAVVGFNRMKVGEYIGWQIGKALYWCWLQGKKLTDWVQADLAKGGTGAIARFAKGGLLALTTLADFVDSLPPLVWNIGGAFMGVADTAVTALTTIIGAMEKTHLVARGTAAGILSDWQAKMAAYTASTVAAEEKMRGQWESRRQWRVNVAEPAIDKIIADAAKFAAGPGPMPVTQFAAAGGGGGFYGAGAPSRNAPWIGSSRGRYGIDVNVRVTGSPQMMREMMGSPEGRRAFEDTMRQAGLSAAYGPG